VKTRQAVKRALAREFNYAARACCEIVIRRTTAEAMRSDDLEGKHSVLSLTKLLTLFHVTLANE